MGPKVWSSQKHRPFKKAYLPGWIRSIKVDGPFIDPYLWGPKTTFVVRELGWCPVESPSEWDAYQYDHPMQKYDLPWPVNWSIKYAMRHVHGLALHLPDIAFAKQEECTGNVKRDLFRIYLKYKTDVSTRGGIQGRSVGT